jgi:hypothetical protein
MTELDDLAKAVVETIETIIRMPSTIIQKYQQASQARKNKAVNKLLAKEAVRKRGSLFRTFKIGYEHLPNEPKLKSKK